MKTLEQYMKQTDARLKKIEGDIHYMKNYYVDVRGIAERAIKASVESRKASEKVTILVKGKMLEKAKEDSNYIRELYQTAFLKTTVLTETINAYQARDVTPEDILHMQSAIIVSFDNTDAWWDKRAKYDLGQWIDVFEDLFK